MKNWYEWEGQLYCDGPHPRMTGPAALTRFDGDLAIVKLGPAQTVLMRFTEGADYGNPRDGGDWVQVFESLNPNEAEAIQECKEYAATK